MKPLPDLSDEAAMLLRGKRSALAAARSNAMIELRDAYTALDGADWPDMRPRLETIRSIAEQLLTISLLWDNLK